jgi:chemotaxis protein methyltransferase CheR/type IV pilus assembly protein PilK
MYIDKFMTVLKKKCYLSVTASDISHDALTVGKKAIYHKNRFNNVPSEYIEDYVDAVDQQHYQVKDVLRKRICFNKLNLTELEKSAVGEMNIILCQNVLIYFKREKRIEILNKLIQHLLPEGLLILGAGEITDWHNSEMDSIGRDGVLAFQRKAVQPQRIHA